MQWKKNPLFDVDTHPLPNNTWRPNTAAKLKKQFRSNFTNNSRYFNFKLSKKNINDIFETSQTKENMKKRYKNYTNNLMKEISKKKENQAIKAARNRQSRAVGFKREAAQPTGLAAVSSHPLKKREKTQAVNVNLSKLFEEASAASTNIVLSKNKIPLPTNTWTILGLNKNKATVKNVEKIYKKLALKYHPNKGGNAEKFIKIDRAKNNAIRYITEKKAAKNNPTMYITEKEAANNTEKKKAAENAEKKATNKAAENAEKKAAANKAAANKAAAEKKEAANKKAAEKKEAANKKAAANKEAKKKAAAEKTALLAQITTLLNSESFNRAKASQLLTNYNNKYGGRFKINNAIVRSLRAKVKAVPPEFNEAAVRKAFSNYLVATVKPKYNKALVNAILRQIPNINENTKRQLIRSQQSVPKRVLGTLGSRAWGATKMTGRALPYAVVGGTSILAAGALTTGAIGAAGLIAVPALLGLGAVATVYQLRKILANPKATPAQKAAAQQALEQQNPPTPAQVAAVPPAQLQELLSQAGPTRVNGGGPRVNGGGPRVNGGGPRVNGGGPRVNGGGPRVNGGGGIIFKPQITVGAARIGAQTFGGTRVGGQQMGSQRTSTGNVGGSRATMSSSGPRATMSNSGPRATMGGPVGGGVVTTTPEQLIRTAGGSEAIEKGIEALRSANGNVNKARSVSKLPLKTFTNIYAMGGPVAAKKYVQSRRRRRTVTSKKKRVVRKPRKQYIKLTPYQFKRLTDHIKKNNLRKVLIKEITH
jgi:curved DNA-binding protein CbpA